MRAARVIVGLVGAAMGVYGALRFLQLDRPDLVDAVVWLAGGVLVHDALLAPLTIVLTVLATRVVPAAARSLATVSLVVLATVTVTAIPVLGRFGARPDNPTILPRHYVVGWFVLVALVLVCALAWGSVTGRCGGEERPARMVEAEVGTICG